MKSTIFIFLNLILAIQLSAQTFHALIFVNEKESGREIDRIADMYNMKIFFREIANQIGYSYNLKSNSDNEFTANEVDREIINLNVQENDIVVFYYSGHGYNQGNDQWPTLDLKDKRYWVSDIMKKLNENTRKAKMVWLIADCCNNGLNNAQLPGYSFNPISSDNMKELFIRFSGRKTIIMSASREGQYSWSDLKQGALFGISLRSAIYSCADNSNNKPTWNSINQKARELTLKASGNKQEPQFKIIQSASAFED
jgi:hypothetical protein